jgi:uncharacterized protein
MPNDRAAKAIRDPIHGLVDVYPEELEVIENRWFQRLRAIRQLSLVNRVYPGADHTRFSHSLGVMHLAGRAVTSICQDIGANEEETRHFYRLARLAGLVHDVGHAPFSHAGEKELFENGLDHEAIGERILLEQLETTIKTQYERFEITADVVRKSLRGLAAEWRFVTQVLSGATDVDKMDYLLRDGHYCGARFGDFDLDRLIGKMTARWTEPGDKGVRAVAFRRGALHALEEFLLARYWMFNSVYYHPVVRQVEIILTRAMQSALSETNGRYPTNLDEYFKWNDDRALTALAASEDEWARRLRSRRPFFKIVYRVNPASEASAAVIFASLRMALDAKFGDQVVADEPPVGIKFYSEDDEGGKSAVRVERYDGTFVPVREASAVLATIPDSATAYSIFAEPEIADEAKAVTELHLKGLAQ